MSLKQCSTRAQPASRPLPALLPEETGHTTIERVHSPSLQSAKPQTPMVSIQFSAHGDCGSECTTQNSMLPIDTYINIYTLKTCIGVTSLTSTTGTNYFHPKNPLQVLSLSQIFSTLISSYNPGSSPIASALEEKRQAKL